MECRVVLRCVASAVYQHRLVPSVHHLVPPGDLRMNVRLPPHAVNHWRSGERPGSTHLRHSLATSDFRKADTRPTRVAATDLTVPAARCPANGRLFATYYADQPMHGRLRPAIDFNLVGSGAMLHPVSNVIGVVRLPLGAARSALACLRMPNRWHGALM